ncbi:MAG: VWA domain-containing protein, partial [Nitrospirae bacterium]|nr:VWA domain-containing protein [Nitrospirota bacterium]
MKKTLLIILFLSLFAISNSYADTVLFVFDVSGSMNKSFGKETRIVAAKRVFSEMVRELPKDLNVGLEVYGHYGDKDCKAIELLVPPSPNNPDKLISKVEPLIADRGATPIADALKKAATALKSSTGNKTVVLITDGIETCGGDPVATLNELSSKGIKFKVHVVGIGVSDLERNFLEKIAIAGGGNYYQANDANALSQGLKKIKKQIAAHKTKIIFKDGFDDDFLSEAWEVKNPDPDNLIIEEGYLQVVTQTADYGNPINFVILKKPLPRQYEIILRLRHTLNLRGYPYTSWYNATVAGLML